MYLKTIFREGLERKIAVRVFFAVHRLSTAKNAAKGPNPETTSNALGSYAPTASANQYPGQ